jgi:UDP-N-acetylglucosamine 2-epimerase (non-hydrolysing)
LKKILIIVGTRPEAIKLLPVHRELKKELSFETLLISTGQHREMLEQIFSFFEVKPDLDLKLMTENQTLSGLTSILFDQLGEVIRNLKPDLVMVQGDTTTAMVAAMIGYYNQAKVAHVEAGLRSFNKLAPFPEEINRKIISQIADIHFAPTIGAEENLKREQQANIHVVGNTVIDGLIYARKKLEASSTKHQNKFPFQRSGKKLILVTTHRRESFGNGLKNICDAIHDLSILYANECEFVFPVHLNPNIREPVHKALADLGNVHLLEPQSYGDLIFLLSQSFMVLTDSGGIQEEAPSFNVPYIVLREVTERPEGIESGCGVLAGIEKTGIMKAFTDIFGDEKLHKKMSVSINPFGDGHASEKIVLILAKWFRFI